MPQSKRMDDEDEQVALIENIIDSRWFRGRGAELRMKLLRHLFTHKHEGLKASAIGAAVLPRPPRPTAPQEAAEFDRRLEAAARKLMEELRDALIQYNLHSKGSTNQKWRCELPKGTPHGGNRLELINQEGCPRVTLGFWQAHLTFNSDVKVVCNAPLFYRDPATNMVFRFADINTDEINSARALQRLKRDHKELYNKGVYVSHLYLLRGEVEARDCIQGWFLNTANVPISKGISHLLQQSEIDESSPILLGNTRTNQFMLDILQNYGQHLQIRVDHKHFGTVELHQPTDDEKSRLRARKPPLTIQPGDEKPRLRSQKPPLAAQPGDNKLILPDQPRRAEDQERDVFAVITRIPNPSGEGVVTILWSDYTRVLGQVARLLTKDDWLTEALNLMGWPLDKPAPFSFEALLVVRLRGEEAAKPELLVWRTYE